MAFFHLSDRRKRPGFPGSLAVASCSGRLVPRSSRPRAEGLKRPGSGAGGGMLAAGGLCQHPARSEWMLLRRKQSSPAAARAPTGSAASIFSSIAGIWPSCPAVGHREAWSPHGIRPAAVFGRADGEGCLWRAPCGFLGVMSLVDRMPNVGPVRGCPCPGSRRRRPAEPWMAERRRLRESECPEGRSERPATGRGQPRTVAPVSVVLHALPTAQSSKRAV
jgi:hypothetical protein